MSLEHAQKFTIAAINDPALAKEISEAVKGKGADSAAAAFAALGKSKGYDFTAAEAAQTRASLLKASPMSEGDLAKVAGGFGQPVKPWQTELAPPPYNGTWEDLIHIDPNEWGWGPGPDQRGTRHRRDAMPGSNPATWGPPLLRARALFDWS